jgi:DNA-binding transcriptional LysR family regulator
MMSDLTNSELRRLDLTLLLVFLGLIRHRKALDVASELGLTQSAISQSLKRLRDIFGDDLFLRRPHGLEPTAVALALEVPLAQAVDSLRTALGATRAFDPATARGHLRVAALDAQQAVLIPPLAARLQKLAPGLTLSALPLARGAAIDALTQGQVDLAFGFIWDTPGSILHERLYDETYLVVGRPASLPDAPMISLDAYCAADHVLVAPGGDLRGVVDEQLESMGRSRKVVLGLPAFLPALAAVSASSALATLPARVAQAFAPGFGLVTAQPPLDIRSFPVSVFWHRRNNADPRITWVRQQVVALV